jgi:hypothetical protein
MKKNLTYPSWKGVIQWGGICLFVAGVILIIFFFSIIVLQLTLPIPAKEALEDPLPPTVLFLIAATGELLLLPGVLALYFSLKDIKRTPIVIATALWSVSVIMFLASRGLIISLSQISGRYMDTTNETLKAAYLASAELALETQNIYSIMAVTLLSVATIIIGLVMLEGVFGKRIGYVVIVAGILSIFAPFAVILGIPLIISIVGLILSASWQMFIGIKLYKLGKDGVPILTNIHSEVS